jgi:hypothetical protein
MMLSSSPTQPNAIKPTLDEHHKFARVPHAISNQTLTLNKTMPVAIQFMLMRNGSF